MLGGALPGIGASATSHWTSGSRRIRLADGRWLGYQEYGDRDGPLVFYFHGTPGSRV